MTAPIYKTAFAYGADEYATFIIISIKRTGPMVTAANVACSLREIESAFHTHCRWCQLELNFRVQV